MALRKIICKRFRGNPLHIDRLVSSSPPIPYIMSDIKVPGFKVCVLTALGEASSPSDERFVFSRLPSSLLASKPPFQSTLTRKKRRRSRRCIKLPLLRLEHANADVRWYQNNGIFELQVTNDKKETATWTIDLKKTGTVYKGKAQPKADVTIILSDDTLEELAAGKVRLSLLR
jgi:SCP-2 sterol transfer family